MQDDDYFISSTEQKKKVNQQKYTSLNQHTKIPNINYNGDDTVLNRYLRADNEETEQSEKIL